MWSCLQVVYCVAHELEAIANVPRTFVCRIACHGQRHLRVASDSGCRAVSAMPEYLSKQGVITKQGHLFKTWKRRWAVLEQHTLSYYAAADAKLEKRLVAGGPAALEAAALAADAAPSAATSAAVSAATSAAVRTSVHP